MAGGIDWLRWHHGSVSDGKFALVAHKAGASVAEVIAVWACLLEAASAAEDRGNPGTPDFEALDFSLGMTDGKARRIYERMRERALLDGETGRIASWERRQPKREDDTAAERKRRQREREHEVAMAACVTADKSRNGTQGHAEVTHGHDREEKSREEQKTSEANASDGAEAPARVIDSKAALWRESVLVLQAGGCKDEGMCRSFMGKLVKDYGEPVVRDAVTAAISAQPADAREYLKATCQRLKGERKDPVTVPSTDKGAELFKAAMDERAAAAVKPPAEVLALARRAVRTA